MTKITKGFELELKTKFRYLRKVGLKFYSEKVKCDNKNMIEIVFILIVY